MNRDFKGVWIPKEIWLSTDLNLQEKAFIVEIHSLDNENGCFAGNAYFAEFFQLSKSRVSQIIKGLEEKGLIRTNYIYKPDSKEIDKRIIRINEDGYFKILGIKDINRGIKDIKEGYLGNATDNNPNLNNPIKKSSKDDTQSPLIPKLDKKTKKSKDIVTMRGMISAFTQNEDIREKLLEYFNMRLKKGLQPNQWKIILDDLRAYAGDSASVAVDKINGAIAGGYMQIIAQWEKDKKTNFSKPKFDNTAGRKTKAVVNMTEEEKAEFEQSLAVDEDGNPLKF